MTEDLEDRVADLEERVRKLEKQEPVEESLNEGKPVAISEFKQDFDPETYADKVTVVSRYLEKHEGMEGFTVEDLEDGFKRCKWKMPANMSDIISKAAGKGLFMKIGEQDGRKKWMLTETGAEHAEGLK